MVTACYVTMAMRKVHHACASTLISKEIEYILSYVGRKTVIAFIIIKQNDLFPVQEVLGQLQSTSVL